MPILTTLLYASVLALLYLFLSWQVVARRRAFRVGLGDGGSKPLECVIRAHANFAEYVPLALVLLLLLEAGTATPAWMLHGLGILLLAGRVLHGLVGLNRGEGRSPGRFWGTLLTWLMLLLSAGLGLYHVVGRWLTAQA